MSVNTNFTGAQDAAQRDEEKLKEFEKKADPKNEEQQRLLEASDCNWTAPFMLLLYMNTILFLP